MIRAQLRTLLSAEPDLEVVGTGWNGMEAIRLVHEFEPDVLVADQDMDDLAGRDVATHLAVAGMEIRVVLYTTNHAEEALLRERETADWALDEESIDALMAAIRRGRMPQLASGIR